MTTFETGVFLLSLYIAGNSLLALMLIVSCGADKTSDGELGCLKVIGMFLLFGFIAFVVYR